ncbi:MAG: hypothetical protein QGF32_04570 [Candidatus Thalassarchaeaceae archaeon]|jgi:hypothetical protein|nr:hypothetical protein [Candidatus Thalassarchaeaceae archaeon]|tara:strand:+ start:2549 stop:2785 length:237 start_codon:yes stop_codon:yes gene_type:complete
MVGLSEILATFVMIAISGYLVWTLLGIRQRRIKFAIEGGDDYSGDAKEPEALTNPDDEALEDMDNLLEKAGFAMPEEE